MLGPYPGVDGANVPDEATAIKHLAAILADGIDTFISLCAELEPQSEINPGPAAVPPDLPKYRNYAFTIKQHSLTKKQIKYIHFPIRDHGTPPDDIQLAALLTRILEKLHKGHKLYIHCLGGHGRTGTLAGCLLAAIYPFWDSKAVLEYIQYAHNSRITNDLRCKGVVVASPNTQQQRAYVRRFAEYDNNTLKTQKQLATLDPPAAAPIAEKDRNSKAFPAMQGPGELPATAVKPGVCNLTLVPYQQTKLAFDTPRRGLP